MLSNIASKLVAASETQPKVSKNYGKFFENLSTVAVLSDSFSNVKYLAGKFQAIYGNANLSPSLISEQFTELCTLAELNRETILKEADHQSNTATARTSGMTQKVRVSESAKANYLNKKENKNEDNVQLTRSFFQRTRAKYKKLRRDPHEFCKDSEISFLRPLQNYFVPNTLGARGFSSKKQLVGKLAFLPISRGLFALYLNGLNKKNSEQLEVIRVSVQKMERRAETYELDNAKKIAELDKALRSMRAEQGDLSTEISG